MKRFINFLIAAITGVLLSCQGMQPAHAAGLPGDAPQLLPVLRAEIDKFWPDLAPRAFVPALIEQESLWKMRATLKTPRELGCGLGQFTLALDSHGKTRFDALEETRQLDKSLAGWSWKDCYNAHYQLRAVVIKLKAHNRNCSPLMADNTNVKACTAAQYNGGAGSTAKRIRYCRATPGCNDRFWFGHLEYQCPQSRTIVKGYGESFCDINSKYPARVFARMPKYGNSEVWDGR